MGKYSKFTDPDYQVKTFRWPYWLLPLLFLSLLLVLGLFIFITIHSADNFGCLFHCDQKIDNGGVIAPDDVPSAASSRRNNENSTGSVGKGEHGTDDDLVISTTGTPSKKSPIKMITVSGKLFFPSKRVPEAIPPHSHLTVKFEDSSLQDASSENLAETVVDVTKFKKGTVLEYEIKCPKPKNHHDFYSVSAVLNMGWTPTNEDTWLRKGDYFTDTMYNVKITERNSTYVRDITLAYNP